jgi:hypothetical protein
LEVVTRNDKKDAARGSHVFAFPQPSGEGAIMSNVFSKAFDTTLFKGSSNVSCVCSPNRSLSANGSDEPCGFT